jgi:hypothetical protein
MPLPKKKVFSLPVSAARLLGLLRGVAYSLTKNLTFLN